ncbi:LmbU family transcriptional regulator [Actinomadura fibrosa]|uniref:LmbU family transcriptional regulator n=1 Tax=Actinomadura fibrosa TaxID=111802 RepID=A0ABW2XWW3_9ACTN|nr:LmbU family transcriptional regulator [Actinomadura fibrosa]
MPKNRDRMRTPIRRRIGLDERALTRRTGLDLPSELPLEDWQRIGRQIFVISDASAWWLGDWLVYGQNRYPERYQRALDETGLNYQTLRNYAWVARKFEPSVRHEGLSIQHHAEVAALPAEERERWLDRAERFGWSRNKLRQHLKASRAGEPEPDPVRDTLLQVPVEPGKVSRWREAADVTGNDLGEWISEQLDRAADDEDP